MTPKKIWFCKIGEVDWSKLPKGADAPMRIAIGEAYLKLTGETPKFLFSGWGGELNSIEREIVNERQQPDTSAKESEKS